MEKNYSIFFENKESKEIKTKMVRHLSFPEACSAAYRERRLLGYSWEIVKVEKEEARRYR